MEQSQIKLIATDLDGTFLRESCPTITREDVELIRAVQAKGFIFAVASGRPYGNVRRAFAPVAEDMLFVCENGANVMWHDKVIYRDVLNPNTSRRFIDSVRAMGPEAEIIACTVDNYVMMPKRDQSALTMLRQWGMSVRIVPNQESIVDDILKLSVFMPDGVDRALVEQMRKQWQGEMRHCCISGSTWVDFQNADKGLGLIKSAEYLGIPLENMMAFGDNYNDIEMFQAVGHSYVMEHSPSDVKQYAKYQCSSVQDVLRELIR